MRRRLDLWRLDGFYLSLRRGRGTTRHIEDFLNHPIAACEVRLLLFSLIEKAFNARVILNGFVNIGIATGAVGAEADEFPPYPHT